MLKNAESMVSSPTKSGFESSSYTPAKIVVTGTKKEEPVKGSQTDRQHYLTNK